MPEPRTPPLPPPPEDAVRLWIAWQAAREHTTAAKRAYPSTEESVAGGIALPLWDERVVVAMRDEVEAGYRFHSHPWWYGADNGAEADEAIAAAAAELIPGP